MTSSDFITIIGTLASFYGAYLAWQEAKKAKTSAELAKRAKEQLINHRKTSELSELQVLLSAAEKSLTKYKTANPTSLVGSSHHSDSEPIVAFMSKLKAYNEYFFNLDGNVADKAYKDIDSELISFRNANDIHKISHHGITMLNIIVNFAPILKREFTEKKEHTVD